MPSPSTPMLDGEEKEAVDGCSGQIQVNQMVLCVLQMSGEIGSRLLGRKDFQGIGDSSLTPTNEGPTAMMDNVKER